MLMLADGFMLSTSSRWTCVAEQPLSLVQRPSPGACNKIYVTAAHTDIIWAAWLASASTVALLTDAATGRAGTFTAHAFEALLLQDVLDHRLRMLCRFWHVLVDVSAQYRASYRCKHSVNFGQGRWKPSDFVRLFQFILSKAY
jgi:hypothetical protein